MKDKTLREINAAFTKQDQEKLAALARIANFREQPEARFLVEMVRRMHANLAAQGERIRLAQKQRAIPTSEAAIPETMESEPVDGISIEEELARR